MIETEIPLVAYYTGTELGTTIVGSSHNLKKLAELLVIYNENPIAIKLDQPGKMLGSDNHLLARLEIVPIDGQKVIFERSNNTLMLSGAFKYLQQVAEIFLNLPEHPFPTTRVGVRRHAHVEYIPLDIEYPELDYFLSSKTRPMIIEVENEDKP